ncbi:MAG: glycerophosphodiester phosphodiesterase, partial [Woeseia sp.]|nr:glycerophosphodiester phosphodiesterase [Woeseia sp.]
MTRSRTTPPLVIAHRGACGYLPEHTLEAKALAVGLGADYLEQDVVISRDDELIVSHDIHLDRVTNVAEVFPGRQRDDGRFYVRDFDLAELRQLLVWERFSDDEGRETVFPDRFPARSGRFRIATLDDELQMVAGLNRSRKRRIGIYPELKAPAWHRTEGVDGARLLLAALSRYGYTSKADPVFLQCFDARELRRIREELGCRLRTVQLIADNSWGESDTDYEQLLTAQGLENVAEYADAIGPWLRQLYVLAPIDGTPVSSGLVSLAHSAGLEVHPYTFRADALEPCFEDFDTMVHWFCDTLGIDGLFTDFPDLAISALT